MANAYGIDDISLLSGPAQNTANQIKQAFTNSMLARDRAQARYGLPALANFNEDTALARAQAAAGAINQNQQLQNMIDASHATPHGVAANLAAYAPYLGLGAQLAPLLFGTDATNKFMQQGLFNSMGNALKSWTDRNTGMVYHFDAAGNIVDTGGNQPLAGWNPSAWDAGYNVGGNAQDFGTGGWGNYGNAADYGTGSWTPDTGVTTAPYDFGSSPVDAGTAFDWSGL